MSMFKFFNQNDSNGQPLSWSQDLDAPFRGRPPLLEGNAFQERIVTSYEFKSMEFDLHDNEHKKLYEAVMDRVVNGWYHLHMRKPSSDTDGRVRYMYVEWSERYTIERPPSRTEHGSPS